MSTNQTNTFPSVDLVSAFRVFLSRYLNKNESFDINIPAEKGVYFVNTVYEALKNKKKIFVFGDYDNDGIVSTTFKVEMIKDFAEIMGMESPDIDWHIPRRADHYGLKYEDFQYYLKEKDLVITSDNGTHKEFFSRLKDEDFGRILIVDHHPNGDFSDYENVINPNTDGSVKISTGILDEYLFQTFRSKFPQYKAAREKNHFRDLTAITLISDMADTNNPIVRQLVTSGLEKMSERHRALYRFLFPVFNGAEKKEITVEDVSFKLNPTLGSPARTDSDLSWLIPLIMNKKGGRTFDTHARRLVFTNTQRKEATNYFTMLAEKQYREMGDKENINLLGIFLDECPIGLNGLVSNNMSQKFGIDTFVVSRNVQGDNMLVGSGRGGSIKDKMNMLVDSYPDLRKNIGYGGHKLAIGLRASDPIALKNALSEFNKKKIAMEDMNKHVVFSTGNISLGEYKTLCNTYGVLSKGVPFNDKILVKVSAHITGFEDGYANGFVKLALTDKFGERMTVMTKQDDSMDYKSLNETVFAMSILPTLDTIQEDKVIFVDMVREQSLKPIQDIQINENILATRK